MSVMQSMQLMMSIKAASAGFAVLDSKNGTNTGYGTATAIFSNVKAGDQIIALGFNSNGSNTNALTISDDDGNTYAQTGLVAATRGYQYAVATAAADAATLTVKCIRSGGGQKVIIALRVSGPPMAVDTANIQNKRVFYPSNQPSTDFTFSSAGPSVTLVCMDTVMSGSSPGNSLIINTLPTGFVNDYELDNDNGCQNLGHAVGAFSDAPDSFKSSVTGLQNNFNTYLVLPFIAA